MEEIAKTFGNTVKELNDLKKDYSQLQSDFNTLKTKLGHEQNPKTPPAPESKGNFSEKVEY